MESQNEVTCNFILKVKSESSEKNEVERLIERQRAMAKEEKRKKENDEMERMVQREKQRIRDLCTSKSQQDICNLVPQGKPRTAECKKTITSLDFPIPTEDPEPSVMNIGK